MDTSKAVTHIGLCAGYGGIELGLKRAIPDLRSIALCEIEAFAVANLVAKMEAGQLEPAPVWPNLKTFPWESFRGCVDILTGGYPCQPFSAAGKRQGADDPRHLWPYIARGIRILQPRICFFENVEGHISLGLSDVIEDLAGMGYRTTWGIFSASEVGAPHQRKRVFILAHRIGAGWEGFTGGMDVRDDGSESGGSVGQKGLRGRVWPSRPGGDNRCEWEPPRVIDISPESEMGGDIDGDTRWVGYAHWESLSDYERLCHAHDSRIDELRLLGNGVVPATAELAYRTLARELFKIPANFSADKK
jgi:DNA (cytosine-5)-methyltransferase 1